MSPRNDEAIDPARGALIYLGAEVTSSTDPTLIGLRGVVVDETKNTITIRTSSGDRMVPKYVAVFRFTLPSGTKENVAGRYLALRPEDRLRRMIHD
jgi:ribonuclease P protein subunit POP4